MVPKLFGPIRERYLERQGGYTRVLRIEPIKEDQAPSAILELVDSPVDMRFALTARTVSRQRRIAGQITDLTAMNVKKVTRYRPDGEAELEQLVKKFDDLATQGSHGVQIVEKKKMADPFRRPRYFDKTATRADWQRNVKDEKKRLEPILKMKNMEAEEDYDRLLAQEEQQWHKRYLPRQA